MGYNGYTNYETWLTALWLDEDPAFYEDVHNICMKTETKDDAEAWVYALIDGTLKELLVNKYGLEADLLRAAIWEVNITEIAKLTVENEIPF